MFSLLESCLLNYEFELPLSWFCGQQDLSLMLGNNKAGYAWVFVHVQWTLAHTAGPVLAKLTHQPWEDWDFKI